MTPTAPKVEVTVSRAKLRRAVADYMQSEGCDCCSDRAKHAEDKRQLAELLKAPMYKDGSGYDFGKFKTPREKK
jgi:hypothetical protein